MKILNKLLLVSMLLFTCHVSAEVSGVAPGFALPGIDKEINLADYKGRVVYVDFWASWCSPCKDSFPWMNKMQAKYKDQGLEIIAINVDRKQKDADEFLKTTPAQFAIAFDSKGNIPKLYDIMGMPTAFIIGRDGKVLHNHIGFHSTDLAEYESHIVQALRN